MRVALFVMLDVYSNDRAITVPIYRDERSRNMPKENACIELQAQLQTKYF